MTIDLDAYLRRIGYDGPVRADADTLRALVAAHVRAVPFENLDPLRGVPVADLGPEALQDKLVARGRGGYCYEQNGLMGYVLERLGFGVERLAARVVWLRDPDGPEPAQTHLVLAVTIPGDDARRLVDVGFGGPTPPVPLVLGTAAEQPTTHEPYRLIDGDGVRALQAQIRAEWRTLYLFEELPRPHVDLEVGSWYVSTHPASKFVSQLVAARVAPDGRYALRGRNLAIHRGGATERVRFDTAAQVIEALTGTFGIDVSDVADRAELERRVDEVLDA
ncbi:arylamine N-acetyltransferase family protein [Microbacterium album]|uniref:Arylamine N-acetyltransferase n=1 Tax=Microbacterium album TaxID=2053191 RepID=A0A917MLR5_9MICO|nr:arylamine N-acetyltransferase [Microbacterium album]GGH39846.1 arylamine N-acetyltransferase [Microbacterium album]